MDNFADDEIIMFIESYKQHILENPLLNSKIPIWVEFLKTKKHYRENGVEEDYFFKRRFGITQDDLIMIHKLIDRVKRGKTLTKKSKSNIQGTDNDYSASTFSTFDVNEDYESNPNQFELLGQVQSAMDTYYKKVKKSAEDKDWKKNKNSNPNPNQFQNQSQFQDQNQGQNTRTWTGYMANPNSYGEPNGCIQNEPDRYYTEDMRSTRPQVEFDVQDFGKTNMFNMGKTNIIQQIDQVNNILDNNDLITNDFDSEYKRSVPNLCSKKKVQYNNQIDNSIGNNNMKQQNMDVGAARFWQDQNILNAKGNTRNSHTPNANPFEHQFQYLDGNYNRVPDPRLIGTSSRLENRTTFKN